MAAAALSFRAPLWSAGAPHLVHSRGHANRDRIDAIAPTVLRLETFSKQVTGGYGAYTQEPGSSRYEGGTADGGVWFMPPETDGQDYAADFAPGDRSLSTGYVGMGPGVCLAFGLPDVGTGGVRSGTSLRNESGDLALYAHDAAGAATKNRALLVTTADAVTADVSKTQGAQPQTATHIRVAICANTGDNITMPAVLPGSQHWIYNDGAETLDVYPLLNEYFNAGAQDAPYSLAAGGRAVAVYQSSGKWRAVAL